MTLPIRDDDGAIEVALRQAHLPSLLMSLVHLTGDATLLNDFDRPSYVLLGDTHGNLPAEQRKKIRSLALDALVRHRDQAGPALAAPSRATIRRMMDYIAGVDVPERYVPLLVEELALEGRDVFAVADSIKAPADRPAAFHVLIIGAGMSGLLAAVHLKRARIPFTILEKNADVGGTWFENTYPGCRVDTPNHVYSYSFEADYPWPEHFSSRDVLYAYFRHVADKYDLRRHIRFDTTVEAARYDEDKAHWNVTVRDKSGQAETLEANAVISAVGQLNRPKLPDIEGRTRFQGIAFHSARWEHEHDLTGKRIAVIGTGASAFQFVPRIAAAAGSVTIFQRTPPWLGPTPDYHQPVPVGMKWLLDHVPYYRQWYRFWLFWMLTDGLVPSVTVDPTWNGEPTAVSKLNDDLRRGLSAYIAKGLEGHPELARIMVPSYPPGGKRSLRDDGLWLETLKRDNVKVVTTPIAAITEQGIRTRDGLEQAFDVIVYGTGFEASGFLAPMRITGRGGVDLHAQWAGDARAYLGMTIPNFPNFFCLYGPNTNIVVNGSIIFFSECSIRYIMGCLKLLVEDGRRALECRRDVHDAFNEKVDAGNLQMAWGVPQVSSWYKSASGRVAQNWPFALVDYWAATEKPRPQDFIVT